MTDTPDDKIRAVVEGAEVVPFRPRDVPRAPAVEAEQTQGLEPDLVPDEVGGGPDGPTGAGEEEQVDGNGDYYRLYGPRHGDKPCPVLALGKDKETLYVLSPGGEVMTLTARSNAMGFVALFDGDTRWLIQHFRKLDKDGNPVRDFVLRNAFAWFVTQCRRAGIWDAATRLRGVGVWPGPPGKDGKPVPVLHCGDGIWMAPPRAASLGGPATGVRGVDLLGPWRREGWKDENTIYIARPKILRPEMGNPATMADGRRLHEALAGWAWKRDYDRELCIGWIGVALLGGYPSWRVHAQFSAEFGSGKSKLVKLLSSVLGVMAIPFNDVTEAGARARLSNEGRVLVVDEAENEGGADGKVAKLIGLLRRMAGDDGAQIGRGSAGQTFHEAQVTGCALMAAILPPALQPADRSRIWRGEIVKFTGGDPDKEARIDAEIAWAKSMSAAFRARPLLQWGRFLECRALYRARLIAKEGADGRQSDVLCTLLAGRELMLRDDMPLADEVDEAVAMVGPLLGRMQEADAESSTAALCYNHLMTWEAPDRRGGEVYSIGGMIALSLGEEGLDGWSARTLKRQGLRLVEVGRDFVDRWPAKGFEAGDVWLLVANNHGTLHRVFSGRIGDRWSGGNWNVSLEQLGSGVRPWPQPENFSGAKSRCLAIPLRMWGQLTEFAPDPDTHLHPSAPPYGGGARTQGGGLWGE